MTVILNRPKLLTIGSMKTTHSLEQVEALMWKESNLLRDPNVGKEAKQKARKRLKLLERHFADCNSKPLNGKKYPERMKGFPDDKPMDKKEVLKLIDSVPDHDDPIIFGRDNIEINKGLNLEGVSVGKNTFEYIDKGWSKPKEMKPVNLFK